MNDTTTARRTRTVSELLSEFGQHDDSGVEYRILSVMHAEAGDYALGIRGSYDDPESAAEAALELIDQESTHEHVTFHVVKVETGSYRRLSEV